MKVKTKTGQQLKRTKEKSNDKFDKKNENDTSYFFYKIKVWYLQSSVVFNKDSCFKKFHAKFILGPKSNQQK